MANRKLRIAYRNAPGGAYFICKNMLTKVKKQELIKDLKEKLTKITSAVFADYTGLNVAKMTELRRKLRNEEIEIKVIKKTLIDLGFKQAGVGNIDMKNMTGQIALVLGYQDEVAPAKILYNFAKSGEHLKILGGILENKFIDSQTVISLAKLPSKQELLAKLVGSIAAPMSGMINVLEGNLRGLVYVLSQINH